MKESLNNKSFWLCIVIVLLINMMPSIACARTYLSSWDLVDSGGHLDVDGDSKYMSYVWKGKNIWNSYKKGVIRKDSWKVMEDLYCYDTSEKLGAYAVTSIDGKMRITRKKMEISTKRGKINTVTHELGHALGLGHNRTLGNIMYYDQTGQITLSKEDKASYNKASKRY